MSDNALPKIAQNAPYMVEVEAGKIYSWCSCGLSQTQPFCDGAHKTADTNLKSVKYHATENKIVAFCGCKKTGTQPFCDGAHGR